MNKVVWISLVGMLIIVGMIFLLLNKLNTKDAAQSETINLENPTDELIVPKLALSKREIVADEKLLLSVNHQDIMNYFKTDGQLCDAYYLSNPERKAFCTDKNIFKQKTTFNAIEISADQAVVGFSITAQVMSPDAVVGIFYPKRYNQTVHLISKYYLGNEFLSFAPDGKHFIYQHNCWEGFCGLTIKNTATLQTVLDINNPESVDERKEKAVFKKWIDNQTISYLIDGEPAKIGF